MASIAAAAPMAPRERAARDGRASLFAEILRWRGDVALGCAPSIFRNKYRRAWPGVSVSAHFRQRKKALVISTGQSCKMSEWPIKPSRKLADFQAEYEGSILFTRSNVCLGGCFDAQCHATA
jgi:hypothetical protein